MSKKLLVIITGLLLVIQVGVISSLNNSQAQVATSSITLISPNGGEELEKGGEFNIEFEYSDIDRFMPFLAQGNQISYLIRSFDPTPVTGSPITYTLTIPSDQSLGSYKFLLYGYKNNEKVAEDYSDTEIEIVSINRPNLSLALSDGLIPTTVEKGAKQQVLIKADLIANNYEDIKVSSIYVDQVKYDINPIYGFYQNFYADLNNLKIHEVNQDGSLKFLSSTHNKVELYDLFTNFSLIIPKGDKKTIVVTADIPEVTTATSLHVRLLTSYNLNYIDATGMTTNQIAYFDQNYITGPNISVVEPGNPSITVTSPNGGETWGKGKTYNITWNIDNDNLIGNGMTLHLSKEGDSSFSYTINPSEVIKSTGIGSYQYSWTIPDWLESRTDYKIGIVLEGSGGIQSFSDMSNAPFSIVKKVKPDLAITNLKYWSPQTSIATIGAYVGYEITIKNIGNTKLEGNYKETAYYDDNYLRYEGGISVPVNPGESWTTKQYAYKKIEESGSHTIKLVIDSDNSIDELDETNNERTITFIVPEETGCTDSDDGRDYYTKGTTSRTGPNPLTVADICDNSFSGYNLREYYCDETGEIQSALYNCPYGCQDGACLPGITIIFPNGGEKLEKGKVYSIKYKITNDKSGGQIDIGYSKADGAKIFDIGRAIISTGVGSYDYTWSVPTDFEIRDDYKIIVQYYHSDFANIVTDESDNYFGIVSAITTSESAEPIITQISPSQGKQGETVDVVITGSNFTGASDYSGCGISPVSSSGFELSSCNQVSDTQINATFLIADDATVGARNITVQTPNGTSNAVTFSVVSLTPTPTPTPTECLPDDTLIKLPDDPKIYVIKNCQKKWIQTIEEFQQGGYNWSNVEEVSSPVIQAYADYLEAVANLIRAANQAKVYKIINNKRLWIPTAESFTTMGNNWSDIQDVQETEIEQYPRLKLAKITGDEKVYYLTESGLKRHIPSVEAFNSYDNNWNDIVEISTTELNAYPDSILIRLTGDYKVYKLENNQKRWIKTIEAFNRLGLNWNEIAPVNDTELNAYTKGEEIE